MGSSITVNQDFNFKDIFPGCRNTFKNFFWISRYVKPQINRYSPVCRFFGRNVNLSYSQFAFNDGCIILGAYLEYINGKNGQDNTFNITSNCYYFFYKLKYLVKLYEAKCDTAKDCYEKLKRRQQDVNTITLPNVCDNNDFEKFDNSIYQVMKYLDKLYDNFESLKRFNNKRNINQARTKARECDKEYKNLFEISGRSNNISLTNLLNEYKKSYDQIINEMNENEERQKMAQATSTGNKAGGVLLTCSILIIMFILFKVRRKFNFVNYTRYGIYIQRKTGKLRRMRSKKYKEQLNLMDSIEQTRNDSICRKHKISYCTDNYA
ncbi:variable surface protein [Plasmodium gonderi]|uniref:Variable surface protein n=1 Tax=Plasmodium gonderi TaxID=77519 RepID=A0A1Y1JND9_PLAGO|nr:variable surface protein [Plasmodium gonderi]GAW84106.1 variable surface protein [Plasmodium gonderi]